MLPQTHSALAAAQVTAGVRIRRIAAGVIDVAIAATTLFALTKRAEHVTFRAGARGSRVSLTLLILSAFYLPLRDTIAAPSIGKRLFGLHGHDPAGEDVTLLQRILRNGMYLVAAVRIAGWLLFVLPIGLLGLQLAAG